MKKDKLMEIASKHMRKKMTDEKDSGKSDELETPEEEVHFQDTEYGKEMSNFAIKDSPAKKIRAPQDDPMWIKKKKVAERNIREKRMTFASESEERDYMRRVNSSKFNVRGLPAFYPPDTLSSSLIGVKPAIECKCCGGCCTAIDNYVCPRCGEIN